MRSLSFKLFFGLAILFQHGFEPVAFCQARPNDDEPADAIVEAPLMGRSRRHEIVVLGENVTVKRNETANSVVVIGGDAIIEGDVRGEVVVIFGSAKITGRVGRQLIVVLGEATAGPKAEIDGEAVVIGGRFKSDPGARLHRNHIAVTLGPMPQMHALQNWISQGLLMGRPLPPGVGFSWVIAGMALAVYLLVALMFPASVRACVTTLEERPGATVLAGILGSILLGPVCLLLAVSIVGLPVIPILFCAGIAAVVFGKLSFYAFLGGKLADSLKEKPFLAVLAGTLIVYALYMVPILGFLLMGMGKILAFGIVLATLFGRARRENATLATVPISASAGIQDASLSGGVPPLPIPPGSEAVCLPRAGFWIRLCATALDLLLLGGLFLIVWHFLLLVLVVYFVGMWTWKGTTVGGIVMGLKVVRVDGQPIGFAVALVRSLASIFSFLVLFLGFFWAGWDSEKQSWHDKIAGTVIVKIPRSVSLI